MRRQRATPTDEDVNLFRSEVGTVRRLEHDRTDARAQPPEPVATQRVLDDAAVMRELRHAPLAELEQSEPLVYLREGYAPKVLRNLARGQYAVADVLDLHQMTGPVAADAIAQFLDANRRAGRLCVKIIHGKGLRSKSGGPVLKGLTDKLLRQRGDVVAFRSARAVDGGSGAVIVLMKGKS